MRQRLEHLRLRLEIACLQFCHIRYKQFSKLANHVKFRWQQSHLEAANIQLRQRLDALAQELDQHKQLEAELNRERTQLRTLIDRLPDHIYFKDTEGRMVTCNQAEARRKGKTPEEPRGKTDYDFYPPHLAAQFAADEQALMRSGQALINHEEPNVDLAGNQRWYSTTKVPFCDAAGKVSGLVGITRDNSSTMSKRPGCASALNPSAFGFATSIGRNLANSLSGCQRPNGTVPSGSSDASPKKTLNTMASAASSFTRLWAGLSWE